eukprot:3417002-Prymnesium_polylepis.1
MDVRRRVDSAECSRAHGGGACARRCARAAHSVAARAHPSGQKRARVMTHRLWRCVACARAQAAVRDMLARAEANGNCVVPLGALTAAAARALTHPRIDAAKARACAERAVYSLVRQGEMVAEEPPPPLEP